MNSLKEKYNKKLRADIAKEMKIDNIFAVPNLSKIIVNSGVSDSVPNNPESLDQMREIITAITGQVPVTTKARASISNFHIREGMNIGVKVTLRSDRMWDFYQKLVDIVIPRFRDFRGLTLNSFDGKGNYSIGIKEHSVFSEVAQMYGDKVKSLQITIVTTAKNDNDAKILFKYLGLPLVKDSLAKK
ncbi:MAG: 50S ribosomal protein L5 [Patescibacteria group bacterium]